MTVIKPKTHTAPQVSQGAAPAVTPHQVAVKLEQAVADGYLTRQELDGVRGIAQTGSQPLAKQLATTFAALAEAKFSTTHPDVKGFADRLARLFHKPDPVTQVPSTDLAESTLRQLWESSGNGSAGDASAIIAKAKAGQLSVLEGLVEGTGLGVEGRAALLVALGSAAKNDGDAKMLLAAADTGFAKADRVRSAPVAFSAEQDRDFAVALAKNPHLSLDTVLTAAEPLDGHNVGWSETTMRLRSDVMHAALVGHPDAASAQALIPQLNLLCAMGSDLKRQVVPFAEALLAHGAPLGELTQQFPGVVDLRTLHGDSPKELGELILKHVRGASGADTDAVAAALTYFGDFPLEKAIVAEMIAGKASVPQVLEGLKNSGTTMKLRPDQEIRAPLDGVGPQKAELALSLLDQRHLGADDQLAVHAFVRHQGGTALEVKSLGLLIDQGTLSKDQLRRLIDDVQDTGTVATLNRRLGTN